MVADHPVVAVDLKESHLNFVLGHHNCVSISLAQRSHYTLAAGAAPK